MAISVKTLRKISTNVRKIPVKRIIIHSMLTLYWYVSPSKTIAFVKRNAFSPFNYPINAAEQAILDSGASFQLDINGKAIRGWQWRNGPAVLFVHGWNGRGIQFKEFIPALLRAGLGVITFDAPAHGASGGTTSSFYEWTDAVSAILDLERGFHVQGIIAHSLGGAAAVNALTSRKMDLPMVLAAPMLRLEAVLYKTLGRHGIPDMVCRKAIETYEHRFGYTLKSAEPANLLRALNSDCLLVHDRKDRMIPIEHSEKTAGVRNNIILKKSDGLGHNRILSKPETVQAMVEFIINRISPVVRTKTSNKVQALSAL